MQFMLKVARWIDRLSEGLGWMTLGFTLIMVFVGTFNAVARYLGRYIGVNLSSNLYIEVQWYLCSLVFLLGAPYVLKKGTHVRVDIVYSRLTSRGKAWVDLFGSLLLLLPMCITIFLYSYPSVLNSWKVLESSSDPSGLPRYPLKTFILVSASLIALQGISEIIKQIAILRNLPLNPTLERRS